MLDEIEAQRDLRVVYACESGSRAWGFASGDSDFDVRVIFVRPAETYLRLRPPKDAFDIMGEGELDLGGWDIRKAAELMRKPNPPLLEWLDSPIVYRADGQVSDELIRLRSVYFDAKKSAHHYLSMAKRVFESYLGDPMPKRKKYLYALRPLACIRYIELHGEQPPTAMPEVLKQIDWDEASIAAVDRLIQQERAGDELGAGPRDVVLDNLITSGPARAGQAIEQLQPNSTPNANSTR